MADITVAKPLEKPEWEDRISNPESYPVIKNKDGSISTHEMASETDGQGNWYVFPTIIQETGGSLKRFENPQNALSYALRTGNYKPFTNKEDALDYSAGGYKTEKFNEYYNNLMSR
tara:strand:- start:99 stop:446 length:348 start_codon:yes stop_codon:yes gene_type:complete